MVSHVEPSSLEDSFAEVDIGKSDSTPIFNWMSNTWQIKDPKADNYPLQFQTFSQFVSFLTPQHQRGQDHSFPEKNR